jgi:hypothetical protein
MTLEAAQRILPLEPLCPRHLGSRYGPPARMAEGPNSRARYLNERHEGIRSIAGRIDGGVCVTSLVEEPLFL